MPVNMVVLTINYSFTKKIDLDASICMDIIIMDVIKYERVNRKSKMASISAKGINNLNEECKRIIYAAGLYKNIIRKNSIISNISKSDVITFTLKIQNSNAKDISTKNEIIITELIDYIEKCLSKTQRQLEKKLRKEGSKNLLFLF